MYDAVGLGKVLVAMVGDTLRTTQDGHTVFYRLTGAEHRGEVAPLGEVVMARMPVGANPNRLGWHPDGCEPCGLAGAA